MATKINLALFISATLLACAGACFTGSSGDGGGGGRGGGGWRRGGRYIKLNELTTSGLDAGDAARAHRGRYYIFTGPDERVIQYTKRMSRNIHFQERRLPFDEGWGIDVKVVRIGTVNGDWTGEKRVALARRLIHKRLVSGYTRCNGKHYKDYILYGTTYSSRRIPNCPLSRPLRGISLEEINSPGFYLLDGQGNRVVVSSLESYDRNNPSPRMSPDENRSESGTSYGSDSSGRK